MKMQDLKPQHLGATIHAAGSVTNLPMTGVLTMLTITHTADGAIVGAAYLDDQQELEADEELELIPDGS